MSLKAVHFFFILVSIAFSAYFSVWCLGSYSWDTDPTLVVMGFLSALGCAGLIPYLIYFLKKTRNYSLLSLSALLVGMVFCTEASACPVCLGNPNSPLVKSVNLGVEALLFFIIPILLGFAGLFIFWATRANRHGKPASF